MVYRVPDTPAVQLALDFLNLEQALRLADEAVPAGIGWIEVGTPLIKSEGLEAVRAVRARFPEATVVADMKVMDAGRTEVEAAQKAGADVVMVLAAATDATIGECVEAGRHLGCAIGCDLVGLADPVARAEAVAALGVDLVSVHTPIDQQMEGGSGGDVLARVAAAVALPVMCAGGISAATAPAAVAAGARVVIVGGAISKAADARDAASAVIEAVRSGRAAADSEGRFTRVGAEGLRELLGRISTPNLSDAMHRGGVVSGLTARNPERRLCGPAYTVQTVPGDWAKPVQAIDRCRPGDVLVIDAGGCAPALWGGLATTTALVRGLGGVVIHGACRDVEEIVGSGLAVWSSLVSPGAGEPKGVGALELPVAFGGQSIHPGDWLVGDANGLVVVPAARAVATANRAMDVKEREERVAAEIATGKTLAEVAELARWESVGVRGG